MSVTVSFNRNQYQIENADYYVAPAAFGGSDSNPGTIGSPFLTIQKAHDVAVAGDFQTLSFTANTGARQSDGSLPSSNFLRLVGGSDLIDAGVDVGLPYNGSAPDLGAYET